VPKTVVTLYNSADVRKDVKVGLLIWKSSTL